jgi:hypothetical protein
MSLSNIFNKLLKNDPNYLCVKDKNNILKKIVVSKPDFYDIRIKFGKYQIMENKEFFYKAQRLYHILLRFVKKCKFSHYKIFNTDCDMRMMPFEPKTTIQIVESKCVYTFNLYDLVNIVNSSLSQQNYAIISPKHPKNPYTNLELSFNNLYNIYIKCLDLKVKIPKIFEYYYECNFCIKRMVQKYKKNLTELAIDNYLSKDAEVDDDLIEDIYTMCDIYYINVHCDFPPKQLYAIFRPYLKMYYKCNIMAVHNCDVSSMIDCFNLYNPFFGRKYETADGQIGFDDRHISFQEIKEGTFKYIRDTKMFEKFKKYSYDETYCISLMPLADVKYFEIEPDDICMYEDSDDDNDP